MKLGILGGTMVAAILMLVFGFMAVERAMAVSGTNQAIDTIEQGLDWDGKTKISTEQKADRLQANLDVLVRERSQRNRWGGLAMVAGLAAITMGCMTRKQAQSLEHAGD